MGAGNDTFTWDPGDGSHLKFTRDVASITMDTVGVEQVDFNALGGADVVTVNDLTGTDITGVNVDLAGTLGGTAGDGQADRIIVNGTAGNDAIDVSGDAGGVKVSGLAESDRARRPACIPPQPRQFPLCRGPATIFRRAIDRYCYMSRVNAHATQPSPVRAGD